jgi:hypothetical protein
MALEVFTAFELFLALGCMHGWFGWETTASYTTVVLLASCTSYDIVIEY